MVLGNCVSNKLFGRAVKNGMKSNRNNMRIGAFKPLMPRVSQVACCLKHGPVGRSIAIFGAESGQDRIGPTKGANKRVIKESGDGNSDCQKYFKAFGQCRRPR